MAPVVMNIVCFRYNPGGLSVEELNALNEELLIRLHESGIAAPSYTTLDGEYCLRAALSNHRTRLRIWQWPSRPWGRSGQDRNGLSHNSVSATHRESRIGRSSPRY